MGKIWGFHHVSPIGFSDIWRHRRLRREYGTSRSAQTFSSGKFSELQGLAGESENPFLGSLSQPTRIIIPNLEYECTKSSLQGQLWMKSQGFLVWFLGTSKSTGSSSVFPWDCHLDPGDFFRIFTHRLEYLCLSTTNIHQEMSPMYSPDHLPLTCCWLSTIFVGQAHHLLTNHHWIHASDTPRTMVDDIP